MAVLGLRFCERAFSSCGKWGPLFIAVRGPLTIAASLVAEHRLQTRRLSNYGSRAQLLRGMWDLPRPGHEPVSPALAGRFSTTAPPGKPFSTFLMPLLKKWGRGNKANHLSVTWEEMCLFPWVLQDFHGNVSRSGDQPWWAPPTSRFPLGTVFWLLLCSHGGSGNQLSEKRQEKKLKDIWMDVGWEKEGSGGDSMSNGKRQVFLNGSVCLCLNGSCRDPLLSLAIVLQKFNWLWFPSISKDFIWGKWLLIQRIYVPSNLPASAY